MTDSTSELAPDEATTETIAEPAQSETPPAEPLPPLRSVHTSTFPQILKQLKSSVLVSTYQAGRLVILRADGDLLNTHFRMFNKPMGLALDGGRLGIGTGIEVWEFHNVPAVCKKLDPPDKHDACFLPRRTNCTGDVQIHEMAWVAPKSPPIAQPELWFVNTLFSCLCTRSDLNSFEPRWRPSFITALEPSDRCHLNGLAVRDGKVRYVTALGETDTPGGWRENKRDGGLLIDVESSEILLRGLSMPHSPRWYRDKLWLLESGKGTIGYVDPEKGYVSICEMPGFTRGLDFAGPLAFIGLSQVRESAIFSGIPIAERPVEERCCGVWVVNIESGNIVAFVRFEEGVQEIFAVTVMSGMVFPEVQNEDRKLISSAFVLNDDALSQVPEELRSPAVKS